MRLIDADKLIDYFKGQCKIAEEDSDPISEYVLAALKCCIDLFEIFQTEDAVAVVRCKDCKWFDPIKQECCGNIVTDNEGGADFSINFEENDFCSFGERRTDEKINL